MYGQKTCVIRRIFLKCLDKMSYLSFRRFITERRVYSDIVAETGASTATVSRVNRSLVLGKNGYQTLFKKLDETGE